MMLTEFLARIHGAGRLELAADFEVDHAGIEQALLDLDTAVRVDGPRQLPPLDPPVAVWAVERMHAACVSTVHRDMEPQQIEAQLGVPCPGPARQPSTHFSVDLTMRYLPDLWRLARALAPADPLLVALGRLAVAWPLSSVGIPLGSQVDVRPLLADPGLRCLYVDRILRRQDSGRTKDPGVAAAVAAAVGEHREFARSVLAIHDRLVEPQREP